MTIISQAYSALTFIASPLALVMISRSKRGRRRIKERLGRWSLEAKNLLWFHGASVGEIQGLIPLIKEFKRNYPDKKILLTATSGTGLERGKDFADYTRLLPFDNRFWIRKAVKKLGIDCFVCSETEIWPELLNELYNSGVPVFFVNARISNYSFKYYRLFRGFISGLLSSASGIYTSTEENRRRFIALGLRESAVITLGNSKYDGKPVVASAEQAARLRKTFFKEEGPIVTLGSLRPGEENFWFPEIAEILKQHDSIKFIIAPRHAEKYEYFVSELAKYSLSFTRWSEQRNLAADCASDHRVILLDTFGDLESVYSFTDLAFIGGTLADWGGHNPLEAGQYKCAIAIGPFHSNVADIVTALKEKDGVVLVTDRASIKNLLEKLTGRPEILMRSGAQAFQVWQENSGASQRIVKAVTEQLAFLKEDERVNP